MFRSKPGDLMASALPEDGMNPSSAANVLISRLYKLSGDAKVKVLKSFTSEDCGSMCMVVVMLIYKLEAYVGRWKYEAGVSAD